MAVKFADEIVKEIRERGSIEVPEGYFTGEAFEEWLYKNEDILIKVSDNIDINGKDMIMPSYAGLDIFCENYGEAA